MHTRSHTTNPAHHTFVHTHAHTPQIIYLGGGCLDAAAEVRAFVAATGIPVAQTLMGLGAYPVADPLSLQMLGMHGTVYANYAVDQVRGSGSCLQCYYCYWGVRQW